ncbi:MAG: hypothetical protein AVDCRST_MAG39-685, partial [uncultured Sphingomonadaceae bacterium]
AQMAPLAECRVRRADPVHRDDGGGESCCRALGKRRVRGTGAPAAEAGRAGRSRRGARAHGGGAARAQPVPRADRLAAPHQFGRGVRAGGHRGKPAVGYRADLLHGVGDVDVLAALRPPPGDRPRQAVLEM